MAHPVTPCQFCGKRSPRSPLFRKKFICTEHHNELAAAKKERLRRANSDEPTDLDLFEAEESMKIFRDLLTHSRQPA